MENRRAVITGMGVISSIGNTVEENFQSLINRKPGISKVDHIHTNHRDHIKVGEIKMSNNELASLLNLPESNNYSRTALLAEIAVKEAVIKQAYYRLQALVEWIKKRDSFIRILMKQKT